MCVLEAPDSTMTYKVELRDVRESFFIIINVAAKRSRNFQRGKGCCISTAMKNCVLSTIIYISAFVSDTKSLQLRLKKNYLLNNSIIVMVECRSK